MNATAQAASAAVLVTPGLAPAAGAADLPARDSAAQSRAILLDGPDWRIAADPGNKGREEKWFGAVRPEAEVTPVPGAFVYALPEYRGAVAWYGRSFTTETRGTQRTTENNQAGVPGLDALGSYRKLYEGWGAESGAAPPAASPLPVSGPWGPLAVSVLNKAAGALFISALQG